MLNVMKELEHRDIPVTSISGAVQRVRAIVETAPQPRVAASKLVLDLTEVNITFDDDVIARIAAQSVVEAIIKSNGVLDNQEETVNQALKRAYEFRKDPSHAWMYAVEAREVAEDRKQAVVEGVELKVAVTTEGKIKKGGKQVLALELYKKHVLEAENALSNQEFIQVLIKELGMTKSGASTYTYMCKNKLGEPEGGIVKSKKGRKAA